MDSLPSITVLVPAFNRARLLPETLASILAQPYGGRLEVLVIDDGSTDNTPEIAAKFAQESGAGGRLRVIRQENAGAAAARNRGLRESTTDLIALCDSDDTWTPNHIEEEARLFQKHPNAGFVFGDFLRFEDAKDGDSSQRRPWREPVEVHSGFVIPALLQRNFIVPSTAMFPRAFALEIGGFDPATTRTEDYDFFLRLALRREAVYFDRVCCFYRRHESSYTQQHRLYWKAFAITLQKARAEIEELRRRGELRDPLAGRTISSAEVRRWDALLRARIASFHLRLARLESQEGHLPAAWREARSALHLLPANPRIWTVLWKLFRLQIGIRTKV